MAYNILLVDDDQTQIKVLETVIRDKMKYNTSIVLNGKGAIDMLTTDGANDIDLVLLDLSMPGISGIDVLKAVKPVHPNLPIIVRTGFDDTDLVIQAMKAGATDFVKKIDDNERLETSINNALRLHVLNDELLRLKRSMSHHISFDDIIGKSARRNEVVRLGKKVAQSNIPVLIEGDSGVGKELLARAIHDSSDRNEKPFIAVNCGAIPDNLVESTLFGHEKGSFTGAMYKSYGKFREAEGGTLFLDEVGELTPDIQVKLLRALQDGEIQPVGSDKTARVNVRIISATNRNLSEEVSKGSFREDLFYRLNVFPIYIPALKERKEDIPFLVDFYYKKFAEAEGKAIENITEEARSLLENYHWLGNVRQLKNVLFRAIVLCDEKQLDVHDFPQLLEHDLEAMSQHASRLHDSAGILDIFDADGNIMTLEDIEKQIIKLAIFKYNGHMCEVSRQLNIGRSTLYRKLEDLGIDHAKLKKKAKCNN